MGSHLTIAPFAQRDCIRLIIVWEALGALDSDPSLTTPMADALNFGRLDVHVRRSEEILPLRLGFFEYGMDGVTWSRESARELKVLRGTRSVWRVPGSDLLLGADLVDVEHGASIAQLAGALEDMYYGSFAPSSLRGSFCNLGRVEGGWTHQIVIFSDMNDRQMSDDFIQRIIYRADMDAIPEYTTFVRPSELNRRSGRGAALGPFVSILWGQQDYIENCAYMSTIIGVNAAAVVAEARRGVLLQIGELSERDGGSGRMDLDLARQRVVGANRFIASVENRIAVHLDGMSSLMPYVPALRVESYHVALFEAMGADSNRVVLEWLVRRLTELVRVEQESLVARGALEQEARARRWSFTIGIASFLTVPFGVIFGFFGVGATEVDPKSSMFSGRYLPFYASVAFATFIIACVHFWMYWRHRRGVQRRSSWE